MKIQQDQEKYEELIELLFRPNKTIRDAVHGDIKITLLETEIMDTLTFQRLRGLRQLGMTHLVYPCAMHTRFDHSIGSLYMAAKIVDIVNNNPHNDIKIEPYDKLLIRLCALLHDVSNIPFGHTLEDEGNLFKGQWKDKDRFKKFLGESTEIGKVLLKHRIILELSKYGDEQFDPHNILDNLEKIFSEIENKRPEELPKPYIADIVGNTLCSDLLDYIRRDYYFTGLKGDYPPVSG